METLPRIRRRKAGGEPTWHERCRRRAQGIRPGRWCWYWRADGLVHYRSSDNYPRRSEVAAGLTRWSEVWKAQEHIIDTIARPDDRRAFQDALSLAIARVEVVAEVYAAPHLVARTPARYAAAQALLRKLLELEERARVKGFRLWGERWDCIDWPEWHGDFATKLAAPVPWQRREPDGDAGV